MDSRFPWKTHFVYTTEDGTLLVVGVLVDEGKPNDAFEPILARLPADVGESTHLEGLGVNVDDLVPPGGQYFRYRGSLTTPPCSEGVAWFVRQEPIEFSAEQIGSIAQIIASNNRPVQPRNERSLVLDSPNYIE